eukprot:gnl/TRDRNA2_/TRDRNA2_30599_c0_seq1.p1 gnl/TRDRNA2_/TRDRNA2_30599_c0~~gnl/TRDRNA2_/TRDRNA2_30599_c0_seq1.p1  ORF type:complete len:343 (+),score=48.01 gnl/TRDRNA2_/TRDRNA2_30599_c0_seq1:99-1127(+)
MVQNCTACLVHDNGVAAKEAHVPAGQVFFGSLPCEGPTKKCADRPERVQRDKQMMMPPPGPHKVSSPHSSQGPISQLQEFVQCSKKFPVGSHRQILQWDFEMQQTGGAHMFCATVAFLLEGVPHHVKGTWQSSKKLAQRDSAERALGLFVGRWGELLSVNDFDDGAASSTTCSGESSEPARTSSDSSLPAAATSPPKTEKASCEYDVQVLEDFCRTGLPQLSSGEASCDGDLSEQSALPLWSTESRGNVYQAFVQVAMLGVPHTFGGAVCSSPEAARADTARRMLWYLQCPGYEEAFELNMSSLEQSTIPAPPAACWQQGSKDAVAQETSGSDVRSRSVRKA